MSERKVLNKYYPPDFDPSKIPRVKCPKNRQFTVRLMAPFNMRCKTCGEYIYKGKKFNARKEDVEGEDYLGIRIFRFYIKCTRCLQEISFKTDPQNTDYEIEAGATRNFMALKLAEEQAEREEAERKEEEASNPMKVLENRTKQSKHELELLESLEELKDLNRRQQAIDYNELLSQVSSREAKEKLLKLQEEEDERLVKSIFSEKRVVEEIITEDDTSKKRKKSKKYHNEEPTQSDTIVVNEEKPSTSSTISSTSTTSSVTKSIGVLSNRNKFNSLVKIKSKVDNEKESVQSDKDKTEDSTKNAVDNSKNVTVTNEPKKSALSLLSSYSDSDESNDSS